MIQNENEIIVRIATRILDRFIKEKAKANHAIGISWFIHNFIGQLTQQEKPLFEQAVYNLKERNLVKIVSKAEKSIVLTEEGYDEIFKVNVPDAINKIETKILNRFVYQKSNVNETILEHWLIHNLKDELNPKEFELVEKAINSLGEKGLVNKENRNGYCLVLTKKGFDLIYGF